MLMLWTRSLTNSGVFGTAAVVLRTAASRGVASFLKPDEQLPSAAADNTIQPPGSTTNAGIQLAVPHAQPIERVTGTAGTPGQEGQALHQLQQQQSVHRRRRRVIPSVHDDPDWQLDSSEWTLWWGDARCWEDWSCIADPATFGVLSQHGRAPQTRVAWTAFVPGLVKARKGAYLRKTSEVECQFRKGFQAAADKVPGNAKYSLHTACFLDGHLLLCMSSSSDVGSSSDRIKAQDMIQSALKHTNLEEYNGNVILAGPMRNQMSIGQLTEPQSEVPSGSRRRHAKHGSRNTRSLRWAIRSFAPEPERRSHLGTILFTSVS